MSYGQDSTYPRPSPVPPYPPYHDQQQRQYQEQYNQNGGYSSYNAQQSQPQYPGQTTYNQNYAGGPVQQSPTNYHAAQNNSYNPAYANQAYNSPQQSYNPQAYSPHVGGGQIPSYNPQTYANTTYQYSPQPPQSTYHNAPYPSESTAQATSGPLPQNPYEYHYGSEQSSSTHTPNHGAYSPPQNFYSPHMTPSQMSPQVSPPPSNHYSYQPPPLPRHSEYRMPYESHNISPPPIPSHTEEAWRPSPPIYPTSTLSPNGPFPSPPIPSPGPTPPAHTHVAARTVSTRHPQARPLPGPPQSEVDASYFAFDGDRSTLSRQEAEEMTQEELFSQVENAVLNAGRSAGWTPVSSTSPVQAPNRNQSMHSRSASQRTGTANGHLSPVAQPQYSDDSDAEATAGLEALRLEEEREAAENERRRSSGAARFSTLGSQRTSLPTPMPDVSDHPSDSDDYHNIDMGTAGGGIDMPLMYGADPNHRYAVGSQNGSLERSQVSQSSRGEHPYTPGSTTSFSPFNVPARVDAGGTGGNYVPPADGRRPSFDEGDEYTFNEAQEPERFPDEPPDFFYQPSTTPGRPLPPTPYSDAYASTFHVGSKPPPPYAPDELVVDASGNAPPRSTSLVSHSNTPQVQAPLRSKTDAEERKKQGYRTSGYASAFSDMTPASASAVALDLPSLAAKRFIPSKLGAPDFNRCKEPWAMSALLGWLYEVTTPEQTTELKEAAVIEALVNLFTNKVPTMNIADAEVLSARVVQNLYDAGALQKTEEWVKLVQTMMSGVIFQLTGTGCYSPTLHDHIVPGRCYSHYCQRTLRKVNLLTEPVRSTEPWAEFYKLGKEDLEGKDGKEIERQNVLHEIVQTEDIYMEQLNILRTLYRDPLLTSEPSIITPERKDKFIKDVFGRVDAVKQANEDHLLPQLKYRQQEQGPWIKGFSDIFRQWIRKAKSAYIDYAGSFPGATFTVRREMERNLHFAQFLDQARLNTRAARLAWDTFLKAPITRLQRYSLLLSTVLKNMKVDSEEKTNLQIAFEEVKAVTLECDSRVAEMQRKVDLADLQNKLVLRPGMHVVELNLNHLGRELFHRGDLQRMGGNRFTWLDSHAILFDHYLVVAKTVTQRADQGGRFDKYDVSRWPIPMDLLALESTNDPPVQKSSYVKGITTVTAVTARPNEPVVLSKTNSSPAVQTLAHVNTGVSSSSLHTVTSLDNNKDTERILYPFRVKHLGRETYTLFAYSEQARRDWCNKIIEAKTKHAAALFAQHAEPFRLRIIADSAFVYDASYSPGLKSVLIKGTPVDRALKEVAERFKDTGRPGPVCRARVNCATSFSTPYPGKQMTAIGTDYGVFISELDNPRGWTKAMTIARVTQIAVLEEFNLFLMIAEKQLIAYHLDVICPSDRNGPTPTNDSVRKAPQKLSGHKDVGFFVCGKMKDRTLVFYKKRDNLSSTFKVLEPIYQKSTEKKRGIFKRGNTESFREYDEFYIPTECTGINLFHSSLAVSTARGFEVLTLDRKQPVSVPDLAPEHVQNIAKHLSKDQRALCMLRISDQEFLLCYTTCAVYINKHGDVSRSVIMEFVGVAHAVAMYGAYIILFDNDFVEIRNAQNGRLKQIISGKDIKCLDDGGCWTAGNTTPVNGTANTAVQRTVKLVMQHPEIERTQIVVELLLNEGMKHE